MIFREVDPVSWSLKYNIPLIKEKCRKCGKEVDVNLPVISKDFVGFESSPHECGMGYRISILKPLK